MIQARIILIGCGPHAQRVYLPALSKHSYVQLSLVLDLESQKHSVQEAINTFGETELWLIEPFIGNIPLELEQKLSVFVREKGIDGVIIATEPLVHKSYAEWALNNKLNILIDKPVTANAEVTSSMSNAKGILDDYLFLLEKYKDLQVEQESVFMVNSQRRFHQGFQFVRSLIHEVAVITNCPVTFIQAYHCDGQWRLPNEIVTQEYHPYCFGYGKASHSGYHIFDTIYQLYQASEKSGKMADTMEIASSFIQPNGFFKQLSEEDYLAFFGEDYKKVNKWSDYELRQICNNFGEIDILSTITLLKDDEAVANISVNLIHNGFSGRTWIQPGADLYKGNGRIKHESYHIQQGPFQSIQIHAYQASDKHDEEGLDEDSLGGKNHFDIYVFRNPFISGNTMQPQIYKAKDLVNIESESFGRALTMELVKHKVVNEFVDFLTGLRPKSLISSQIEDHLVPVQIMSGLYQSHILRQESSSHLVRSSFGLVESFT